MNKLSDLACKKLGFQFFGIVLRAVRSTYMI